MKSGIYSKVIRKIGLELLIVLSIVSFVIWMGK